MKHILIIILIFITINGYSQKQDTNLVNIKKCMNEMISIQFKAGLHLKQASNCILMGCASVITGTSLMLLLNSYDSEISWIPLYLGMCSGITFYSFAWSHIGNSGKLFLKANEIGIKYSF